MWRLPQCKFTAHHNTNLVCFAHLCENIQYSPLPPCGNADADAEAAHGFSIPGMRTTILPWAFSSYCFCDNTRYSLLPPFGNADADGEPVHGSSRVTRHPEWQPPQKQVPPYPLQPCLSFDPSTSEASILYPLIISSVVPRPIAFVSTISKVRVHIQYCECTNSSVCTVHTKGCGCPYSTVAPGRMQLATCPCTHASLQMTIS